MAASDATAIYQQLTILLALATLSHFTFRRFRQPTIIGEIAIGVLLGPTILGNPALGPYSYAFDPTVVATFGSLGAIFLLFLIGLESDVRAIYTRKNFFVAAGGVLLPFVGGFLVAYYALPSEGVPGGQPAFLVAMFLGATLVATSTAIAAAVLLEMGLIRDRVAQTILGAAVVDDILGLVVLSVVVGMSGPALDAPGLGTLLATAIGFVALGIFVGERFFRGIVVRIQGYGATLGLRHGGFLIALAITFLYAFIAEAIGLSAIVGAFLAGSMFAATPLREEFSQGAGYLGAVFTPIFFISLGLQVNGPAVSLGLLGFAGIIVAVALVTKVVGCAIPARLAKMSRNEAAAVGWGMAPRGEVGLIVALTAVSAGIITDGLFSVIVLAMVVVSIVPVPFFRAAVVRVARERKASPGPGTPEAEEAS